MTRSAATRWLPIVAAVLAVLAVGGTVAWAAARAAAPIEIGIRYSRFSPALRGAVLLLAIAMGGAVLLSFLLGRPASGPMRPV